MQHNDLLDSYLRQLRLPTFLKNYPQFAVDAAGANLDYPRFLLALAEQEVQQRHHNMIQRRIKAARFPVLKELADFDFSAIPTLNKADIRSFSLVTRAWENRIWPPHWLCLLVAKNERCASGRLPA
jgi:DNA replication protein DnaC